MPKMWKFQRNRSSSYQCQNKAPRLFGLVFVDTACDMHLGIDLNHSAHYKQQNKVENPLGGGMSELRKSVEGVIL